MHVLEFLEKVGQNWQLRHAEPGLLANAMSHAGIAHDWHSAILDSDSSELQARLELSANICCAVHPAHEDEDEDIEDEFDDVDEDDEDEDDFDDEDDIDEDEED